MEATEDWELVGYLAPGKEAEFGENVGRVSRVLPNGSAFVECPELKALYGQDPYVHSTVVAQCALQVDDEIAFNVHVSSRGLPQVSAPCWRRPRPAGEAQEPPQKRARVASALKPGPVSATAALRAAAAAGAKGCGKGVKVEASRASAPSAGVPGSWAKDGVMNDFDKYIMGAVKSPMPSKGFSLIEAQTGHEADVYCHSSVAPPEALQPGEIVAFKLHISPKGQPQASAPLWKLLGPPPDPDLLQLGDFVGQFDKVLPAGSGFVSCPALKQEYSRDTYIHPSVIRDLGLELGDVLAFLVQLTPDGKPQVQAPCWRCCTSTGPREPFPPVSPFPPAAPSKPAAAAGASADAGFQDTAWAVFEQMLASRSGTASPAGAASGWDALPWQAGGGSEELPLEIPVEWMPDTYVVGMVKHTDDVRGLSYVHSPDSGFEKDVFVHKSVGDPGALTIGEVVCFPLHVNAKGQPQASAPFWKRAGWADPDKPVVFGKYEGQIVRVLANGSAFIDCQDVRLAYGMDAYVHDSVMTQCNLSEGNLVRFNVHVNQQGKPQVSAPCWTCCSSAEVMQKLMAGGAQAPQEGGELTGSLGAAAAVGQDGQWHCALCGFMNRPSNDVCGGTGPMGCKAPKPAAQRHSAFPAEGSGLAKGSGLPRHSAFPAKGSGLPGKLNISAAINAAARAAAVRNLSVAVGQEGLMQLHGVIKSFNPQKGYGFISSEEVEGDVWFRKATLPEEHQEAPDLAGQEVMFGLTHAQDGKPQAGTIEVCGGQGTMGGKRPRMPAASGSHGSCAKGGKGAAGKAADSGKAPAVLWPSAAAAAPKSKAAARPVSTPRPPSTPPPTQASKMLRPRGSLLLEEETPYEEDAADLEAFEADDEEAMEALAMLDDTAEEAMEAQAMFDDTAEEDPDAGEYNA